MSNVPRMRRAVYEINARAGVAKLRGVPIDRIDLASQTAAFRQIDNQSGIAGARARVLRGTLNANRTRAHILHAFAAGETPSAGACGVCYRILSIKTTHKSRDATPPLCFCILTHTHTLTMQLAKNAQQPPLCSGGGTNE